MISPVPCWGRRCAGGRDREDGQWHGKHIRVDGAEELQVSALESETLWFDCSLYQWAAPWVFAQSALSFLTCKMKLTASSLIGSTKWDNPWKTPDKPPGTKGVLSKCCPLWLLLSKLWFRGRTECYVKKFSDFTKLDSSGCRRKVLPQKNFVSYLLSNSYYFWL